MTHSSRDTSTGLIFEEKNRIAAKGINLTKYNLYKYLESNNINWRNIISRKILPDEAYFNLDTKELVIYEKKFQKVEGSAEIGAMNVSYIYILSSWFSQEKYRDMLEYIKSVDGCDYIITGD